MSGRTTTPTGGGSAGAAYAAEKSVPSAAVSVRTPRSATSPRRGGAGGRLSWSWHMRPVLLADGRARAVSPSAVGGSVRWLGFPAEHPGGHLPAGVGQPAVLF